MQTLKIQKKMKDDLFDKKFQLKIFAKKFDHKKVND